MKQIGLFILAGGVAASVNVTSRIAFSLVLPLPAAVVLAYACGMLVAFCLNRWIVFDNARDNIKLRAGRFVVVNGLAVLQTLVVTVFGAWLLRRGGVTETVAQTTAHVVGVVVPIFSSFFMHKRWTFSQSQTH